MDTLLHMGQPLRHPAGHGAAAAMAGLRAALKQGLLQAAPMAGPGTLRALRSGALSSVQVCQDLGRAQADVSAIASE